MVESARRSVPPEPAGDEIAELMRRVQRGDRDAFAALYDHLAAAAYGMAHRVVRDPERAEDVVQEAMLEVWRRAARYDADRGSVRAWAMTIVHGRAVDRVRSEQSARDRDDRVARRDHEQPRDVVSDAVEHNFERQQVQRALTDLTDLQREAVELAYYRGLTHREIAEILDVPLGTVKTRIRDGTIRLRDALGVST